MRKRGMCMAVATGKGRNGLGRAFAQTGLGYIFETSRCADETTSKPHPHMLEEILEETGVSSSEVALRSRLTLSLLWESDCQCF